MNETDVLITGAGPTGLVLALWLTRQGARVRLIDKLPAPTAASRALAVQARTLELYRQLDLTDAVLAQGHAVPALNLWVRGEPQARVPFAEVARDITPYGPLIFPQDQHERLLIDKLQSLGVQVERGTLLLSFAEADDCIVATLAMPNGAQETIAAKFLAGCDGVHSIVRETLGIGFPGGTYEQVFYVADVEAAGACVNGELHIDLDEADFLGVFPLKEPGHARLVGTVRDERAAKAETLRFQDVSARALRNMRIDVHEVNWFSTYRVHHRVADRFRIGHAFLLGDAAHVHSPAGGQGMNTGIGDAINLAWKLKAVLDRRGTDALLDTYETERIAFARKLVATTDRVFSLATAEGRVADLVRTRIVPLVVPNLLKLDAMRDYLFNAVSQVAIAYRHSTLSEGIAGDVHGGDRLPWAPKPIDNFDSLDRIGWQVHVYGRTDHSVKTWCEEYGIPLHEFDWDDRHAQAGFARDALYLLRPDTYIAFAQAEQSADALTRYFGERALVP